MRAGEQGSRGAGEQGSRGEVAVSFPLCPFAPLHLCPMPNAQCPMPNAQCPMPNAPFPIPMTSAILKAVTELATEH
ncbi:MAG: hypothetical protein RMZ42_10160 [Nostoc sp. DedQUE05]|uniref:hypothetical protein n=1 Tax=Nostoc sp. DedQUE05 TaxID=3075391 RepID=UPI002AD24842|nr:hypothetical protein [Nostoc sp. DedQUE05]MDZ8092294.1 hypothetical protein [Nostoc sp. DedQUE05]